MSAVMYKLQSIKLTPGVSLHETPREYVFMAVVADIWIFKMQQKPKTWLDYISGPPTNMSANNMDCTTL